MKTKLLFFLSFFLLVGNCFGQITFQKVIYTNFGCGSNAAQQTADGGYIILGATTNNDSNNYFVYLIKTNNLGDTLWTKTFEEINISAGVSVQQTTDSGYIIVGFPNSVSQNSQIYIVKTNAIGDTLWTKAYGGDTAVNGNFIQQTKDGGYIITGNIGNFPSGHANIYLLKINAVGDIVWTKSYGGSGYDIGYSVKQTSDSGYIICGATRSFGAGDYDVYLIKTDSSGDTLWTKTYGGLSTDLGQAIQQTTDGGYIIAGSTYSFGAGENDVYLIKINANGDSAWTKTYGGTHDDFGFDIHQTTDSGYIITGWTRSFEDSIGDVYLIKTNSFGDTIWTKTYGGVGYDIGSSVQQSTDGGYFIAATSTSFVSVLGFSNIYLIKTDVNGNSGCNQSNTNTIVRSTATIVGRPHTIVGSGGKASSTSTIVSSGGNESTLCLTTGLPEQTINNTISIYPNPAGSELRIKNAELRIGKCAIYITNTLGQTVYQSSIFNLQSSINVSSLPSGIYFVRVADEKESWVGKFVKE